jgi:glutamate synthase (NADPH/NADH) large chain
MTGGIVVVLGRTGRNFAAGMSGGTAYVLDLRPGRVNREMVDLEPLDPEDRDLVGLLVARHRELTDSPVAAHLLDSWEAAATRFTKVMPRDYARVLAARTQAAAAGLDPDSPDAFKVIMENAHG